MLNLCENIIRLSKTFDLKARCKNQTEDIEEKTPKKGLKGLWYLQRPTVKVRVYLKSALHLVDFFNVTGPHTSFSNYKMASLVELGSRIHEFV